MVVSRSTENEKHNSPLTAASFAAAFEASYNRCSPGLTSLPLT
jgi:hypothetical protein